MRTDLERWSGRPQRERERRSLSARVTRAAEPKRSSQSAECGIMRLRNNYHMMQHLATLLFTRLVSYLINKDSSISYI